MMLAGRRLLVGRAPADDELAGGWLFVGRVFSVGIKSRPFLKDPPSRPFTNHSPHPPSEGREPPRFVRCSPLPPPGAARAAFPFPERCGPFPPLPTAPRASISAHFLGASLLSRASATRDRRSISSSGHSSAFPKVSGAIPERDFLTLLNLPSSRSAHVGISAKFSEITVVRRFLEEHVLLGASTFLFAVLLAEEHVHVAGT